MDGRTDGRTDGLIYIAPINSKRVTKRLLISHWMHSGCRAHLPLLLVVGILIGTLTMELGGVVTIKCEKTGYWAELEFKLKVSATRDLY